MVNVLTGCMLYLLFLFATLSSQALQYGTMALRDGGYLRTAHLKPSTSQKGTILFLQGMGSFIERHTDTIEELANQGYEVWTFDWRGQGASSRMTKVLSLCHIDRFSTYVEDLQEVIQTISRDKRLVIFANSMGGHIALRYAHDHPEHIQSMVLMAPMFDIKTRKYPKVLAQTLARSLAYITGGESFVFGDNPFDPKTCLEKYRPHTHGEKKYYEKMCQILSEKPELATGGVSFGWLHAAFRSNKLIQQDKYLENISVPTLILTPQDDVIVEDKIQGKICAKMKSCQQILYPQGRHNLFSEVPEIRNKMMSDFYAFIEPKVELDVQQIRHVEEPVQPSVDAKPEASKLTKVAHPQTAPVGALTKGP